jgi:hypothetical protein
MSKSRTQSGDTSSDRMQNNDSRPTNDRAQQAPDNNANANRAAQQSNGTGSDRTAERPDNRGDRAETKPRNNSVNINERERTRVSDSIDRLSVKPQSNVNFSLSVGTVVPRDVHFQKLPTDVVEIVPQYRDYDFFVVRNDIVIVEPSSYKIVDVLPRSGGSTASAPPSSSHHKVTFSDRDREVIRKHSRMRTEPRTTTGSAASSRVHVGDRVPDSVEIRSFSDDYYRDAPTLREYRYMERDNRTYVIEPQERRIIEEIE